MQQRWGTHYEKGGSSYKLEYFGAGQPTIKTNLNGDGDFRSEEAIEILNECDVVVTNPPFSLFREFITLLASYNKKFLVIGNSNSVTYKEVFKLIRSDELWLGRYSVKEFLQPDGSVKKFGNICWFTNLYHSKRNVELIPWKNYSGNELDYPQYDNYDAIEVGKVACVFWLKLDKVSRRNWTRIPFEPGHGFWLKLDKDSSANWTHQIARG